MEPLKFEKTLAEYYQDIPKSYGELYEKTAGKLDIEIPKPNFREGAQRFKKGGEGSLKEGKKGYLRETEYGLINACFLPETDTIKDIREELIDAWFNAMVANFKWPDSRHIEELLEMLAECITWLNKIDRWGQLYVDMDNGVDYDKPEV